jgi:hypothetical protein
MPNFVVLFLLVSNEEECSNKANQNANTRHDSSEYTFRNTFPKDVDGAG